MEKKVKLTAKEEVLKNEIVGKVSRHFGKTMDDATPKMVYTACALTARDQIMTKWAKSHKQVKEEGSKKLYYLSFEFLMGRLLATNVLNLMQTKTYTNALKALGHPLDMISLDCTEACNHAEYIGHMSLERCIAFRDTLKKEGIADENTVFILNHFSHNSKNVLYDDFVEIAKEHDFLITYDGMVYEF